MGKITHLALALTILACGPPNGSSHSSGTDSVRGPTTFAYGAWAAVPVGPGPPPWPLPPGTWWPLAGDSVTRVSLDTVSIAPTRQGEHRVRLLYQFLEPRIMVSGAVFQVLVSEEETDCARQTAHVLAATLFDTLGREIARITEQPDSGPPSMVGAAGAPLCVWLRAYAARHRA